MLYYADVVHHTPNRVRIKLQQKPHHDPVCATLANDLARMPGVESVEFNPRTGSFLLKGRGLNVSSIVQAIAQETPLRFEAPQALHPVHQAMQPFKELNVKLKQMSGGEFGLIEAAFLALLSIGVIQILRGNITAPPWYTAFWYAFGVFTKALIEKHEATPPLETVERAPQPVHAETPVSAEVVEATDNSHTPLHFD